jgi:hypothetical protein
VKKKVPKRKGSVKCTKAPPDCGLLHDKMSLLWGKYKDQVDWLQKIMDRNQAKWELLKSNLNQQLEVLRNTKARFNMQLNEAIANMNSDQEEMSEKDDERRTLEQEYRKFMKSCKKRIEWIMFQDVCAYIGLRATIMKTSKTCSPDKIIDCAWTNWIPSRCTRSCDNGCPNPTNPYACGGWQTLWRNYITTNNACGYKCPARWRRRKCNQFKCPVNCRCRGGPRFRSAARIARAAPSLAPEAFSSSRRTAGHPATPPRRLDRATRVPATGIAPSLDGPNGRPAPSRATGRKEASR